MGNSVGIDSISSIHDMTTALIFHPPETKIGNIDRLNTYAHTQTFDITRKHNTLNDMILITGVEIGSIKRNTIIIYSHGNATDIFTGYDLMKYYSKLFDTLVVGYDYCGYGASWIFNTKTNKINRKPSEELCYKSLEMVIDYCKDKYNDCNIVLIGQSLGTGVTVHYAQTHEWKQPIILISPYKSITRVIADSAIIESSFAHNKFESYNKIEDLDCPVKIIHGTMDKVIDISHGKYLYGLLKKPLKPVWKENCGHNDIIIYEDDIDDIECFDYLKTKNEINADISNIY